MGWLHGDEGGPDLCPRVLAKLSPTQRHRLVGVVVAFFALLATVVVAALAVSGNVIVGVVAAAILVLLLRYFGLARSRGRDGGNTPP